MERIILHIDVNNAFLSWTAVDMLKNGSKVDIRNRYSVIAGSSLDRHGIILAKSNLCKKKGVVTAETLYSAKKKCPYLDVYEPNRKIYKYYSDLMYNYLLNYTNIIERYSIDECFLDYTNSYKLFGDPVRISYKIKEDIKKKFGFTVNVGIGNNKLCAKMASDFLKPDRVHTLFMDEIKSKMWVLPVDDLFMIGKNTSAKLKNMRINTIYDLANCDKEILISKFKKYGKMMWEYANGIDNSEVVFERGDAKSISSSTTLAMDCYDRDILYKTLRRLSMDVGKKLRDKDMYANVINIRIKYANFVKVSRQITLNNSVNNDDDIYNNSRVLFNKLWDSENGVRGLCVGVASVSHRKEMQLSLFNKSEDIKDDKFQKVLDDIRDKYGENSIVYANDGEKK